MFSLPQVNFFLISFTFYPFQSPKVLSLIMKTYFDLFFRARHRSSDPGSIRFRPEHRHPRVDDRRVGPNPNRSNPDRRSRSGQLHADLEGQVADRVRSVAEVGIRSQRIFDLHPDWQGHLSARWFNLALYQYYTKYRCNTPQTILTKFMLLKELFSSVLLFLMLLLKKTAEMYIHIFGMCTRSDSRIMVINLLLEGRVEMKFTDQSTKYSTMMFYSYSVT